MAENKIVLYLVHSLDNVKQDSGLEYENTIDPFGIKFHDDNLGLRFVSTKSFIIARLVVGQLDTDLFRDQSVDAGIRSLKLEYLRDRISLILIQAGFKCAQDTLLELQEIVFLSSSEVRH